MNIPGLKYLITSFILFSSVHSSQAQSSPFSKDTAQLNLWLSEVRPAMDTSSEMALSIIHQMKQLARKLKVDTLMAKVLNEEGLNYFYMGNYKQAAQVWDSCASIWKKELPLSYNYARAVNNIGNAYMYNSEYYEALKTFFNALKISQQINSKKSVSQVLNNIGLVYESIGDYENALLYGRRALAIKKELKDSLSMINTYGNIGNAFEVMKQPDSAIFYQRLSYQWASLFGKLDKMSNALGNMGHAYMEKKEWDSAVYCLAQGISISVKLGNVENNGNFLNLIAYAYLKKGDLPNTLKYGTQATEYIGQITDKEFLQAHYQLFYEYHKKTGNTKKMYEYLEKLNVVSDSLFKEKLNIQNQKITISYEFKEKNLQDSLAYQHQLNVSNEKIVTSRNKYIIALLLFLLAAAIATVLYHRSKLQGQKIKQLENDKLILASQAIVKGQEEERSRLAKDLHDGLGGLLSGVKHSIITMKENVILSGDYASVFEKSLNLIDTASKELRRVAQNMMPEALAKFSLEAALKDYCAAACTSTLKVTFESFGNTIPIDNSSSTIIYRIIQELITNAIKHSEATQVMVQLVKGDDWITLGVEDNGKGFDVALLIQSTGSGWSNIKSRVDYLNGNIDIKSQSDTGTSVSIEIKIQSA